MIIAKDAHTRQTEGGRNPAREPELTAGILTVRVYDRPDGAYSLHHVKSQRCSFGASVTCTVRIEGPNVRPVHCVVLRGKTRSVVRRWAPNSWLNGEFFNDAVIQSGDELTLGGVRIQIVEDRRDSPEQTETQVANLNTLDSSGVTGLPHWQMDGTEIDGKLHARVRAAERRIVQLTHQLVQSNSRWLHFSGQVNQPKIVDGADPRPPSAGGTETASSDNTLEAIHEAHQQEKQRWILEREELLAEIARFEDHRSTVPESVAIKSDTGGENVSGEPLVTSNAEIDSAQTELVSAVPFDPDIWEKVKADAAHQLADAEQRGEEVSRQQEALHAEQLEVKQREEAIASRNADLDEREASLHEWASQLDEFRADLDQRAEEVRHQAEDAERIAHDQEGQVTDLETSLSSFKADYEQRLASYTASEAVWQQKEQGWNQRELELNEQIAELQTSVAAPAEVDEQQMAKLREEIQDLENQLTELQLAGQAQQQSDTSQLEEQLEQERSAWAVERASLQAQIDALEATQTQAGAHQFGPPIENPNQTDPNVQQSPGFHGVPSEEATYPQDASYSALGETGEYAIPGDFAASAQVQVPDGEGARGTVHDLEDLSEIHAGQFQQFGGSEAAEVSEYEGTCDECDAAETESSDPSSDQEVAEQLDQDPSSDSQEVKALDDTPSVESHYQSEHFLSQDEEPPTVDHLEDDVHDGACLEESGSEATILADDASLNDDVAIDEGVDALATRLAMIAGDQANAGVSEPSADDGLSEDEGTSDEDFWGLTDAGSAEQAMEDLAAEEPIESSACSNEEADMLARLRELVDDNPADSPDGTDSDDLNPESPSLQDNSQDNSIEQESDDETMGRVLADAVSPEEEAENIGDADADWSQAADLAWDSPDSPANTEGNEPFDDGVTDDGSDWFDAEDTSGVDESSAGVVAEETESPVSFLDQFTDEVDDEPISATSGRDDLAETALPAVDGLDPNSEDSIEDYMQQLLQRVGQGDGQPLETADVTPTTATDAGKEEEPELDEEPKKVRPRRPKPDPIANLDAMRELANSSTRSHISRHQSKVHETSAWTNLGITVAAVMVGAILLILARGKVSILSGVGAAIEVAAIYFGFRSFSSGALVVLQRLGRKSKARSSKSVAAAAADETPEEATVEADEMQTLRNDVEKAVESVGHEDDLTLREITESVDASLFEQISEEVAGADQEGADDTSGDPVNADED